MNAPSWSGERAAARSARRTYIARWKARFETERLAGLHAKYRGQVHAGARGARAGEDAAEAIRRQQHWTTRNLANVLGISHMLVARVWRRAGYQPHRFERYMLSDDPQFDKAAD